MDEKKTNRTHREGEKHRPRRRKKKRLTILGVLFYLVFVIGIGIVIKYTQQCPSVALHQSGTQGISLHLRLDVARQDFLYRLQRAGASPANGIAHIGAKLPYFALAVGVMGSNHLILPMSDGFRPLQTQGGEILRGGDLCGNW